MNRFGFLFLLHAGLSEAGGGGSSDFLQSTVFLIGIAVFTAIVGGLLVYACLIDIKHWRKSIDGRAQLEFPSASPAEFVLPPIQRTPENLVTPKEPESIKSTRVERSPEEKTLRIVKAMYESSKREIPDSVQKVCRFSFRKIRKNFNFRVSNRRTEFMLVMRRLPCRQSPRKKSPSRPKNR